MADGEITNPTAQGTESADPQTRQNTQEGQQLDANQVSGIQKRIDELTRKLYEKDDALSKANEHLIALTSQLTDMTTRMSQPAPQDPLQNPDLDPAIKQALDARLSQMEQRMNTMLNQMGATVYQSEAVREAQRMGFSDNQWVQDRAAQLSATWRNKGLTLLPADAVRFAAGEWLTEQRRQQASNRDERGRFSSPAPTMTAPNPPPVMSVPNGRQTLPSNFDDLSPDQQMAELEKRGVGDMPF